MKKIKNVDASVNPHVVLSGHTMKIETINPSIEESMNVLLNGWFTMWCTILVIRVKKPFKVFPYSQQGTRTNIINTKLGYQHMQKPQPEQIVKLYALLLWVGAILLLFGGIILTLFKVRGDIGLIGTAMGWTGSHPFNTMLGLIGDGTKLGLLFIAMAVVHVFTGIGLVHHYNWARYALLGIAGLQVLNFPLGSIIGIVGIWFFAFNDDVKRLFTNVPLKAPKPRHK
jgi:hypothetical protein